MATLVLARFIFCFLKLIDFVNSDGRLLIGFLGYSNPLNTDFKDQCCSSGNSTDTCNDCDLLFNVSIPTFNSSKNFPTTGTIKSTDFNVNRELGSISFDFKLWTGEVDILINVFHVEPNKRSLVDNFTLEFKSQRPDWRYTPRNVTGSRATPPSNLKVVLRYECGTKESDEHGQCYNNSCTILPECPPKPSASTITLKPTLPSIECSTIVSGNIKQYLNCTTEKQQTTEVMSTGLQLGTNESFGETTEANNEETTQAMEKTTQAMEETTQAMEETTQAITTSKNGHTTQSPVDTTTSNGKTTLHESWQTTSEANFIETTSDQYQSTNAENLISTKNMLYTTEKSINNEITTESGQMTTANNVPPTSSLKKTDKSTTTSTTTPQENIETRNSITNRPSQSTPGTSPTNDINTTVKDKNDDEAMQYWPGIVGGVLGACLVAAVVSYIIYTRKRRLRKSNNDIYNVNPKRWVFDPPTENGTSGKSEIALETEQL